MTLQRERCPCGRPLHYLNPDTRRFVEDQVRSLGPTVVVTTPDGSWRVPRHYIALHGIKARDLAQLAGEHGWEVA